MPAPRPFSSEACSKISTSKPRRSKASPAVSPPIPPPAIRMCALLFVPVANLPHAHRIASPQCVFFFTRFLRKDNREKGIAIFNYGSER